MAKLPIAASAGKPKTTDPYRRAFVPDHRAPFCLQPVGRDWYRQKTGYLTDTILAEHLAGGCTVGPIPETFTTFAAVDLDAHDADAARTLHHRAEQVMAAIPEATPLVFSTPHNGFHLFFPLANRAWSSRVRAFMLDRLKGYGVTLAPGRVEVYPNGGQAIRAPLGMNSSLIDPHTLTPVSGDRGEHLHTLTEILTDHRHDVLVVPAHYGAHQAPQEAPRGRRIAAGEDAGEFMLSITRLQAEGLWEPSQRNWAFLRLTWYLRVIKGNTAQQAEANLWTWIQARHNGHSREYLADPTGVRRKVRDVVGAFDPDKVGTGRKGEQATTKKRPQRAGAAPGSTRAAVGQYVSALGLEAKEAAMLTKILVFAHRHGERMDDRLEVEIPRRTLQGWNWRYAPILRALMAQGLVVLARNYGAQIGRCRTYRVPFLPSGCSTF